MDNFSDEEVAAAKACRAKILSGELPEELQSVYMAGEIVMWDELQPHIQRLAELEKENNEQAKQIAELKKLATILVESKFNDCFQYECASQNECQTFGCKKQKRINELRNEEA